MNFAEYIVVALEGIRNSKLRSVLTTLGIVIGIAAVIAVVAVGQGGRALLMKEMESFGTNMFVVYVNSQEGEPIRPNDIQEMDVKVIKQLVPEVQYLTPVCYSSDKVRGTQGEKSVQVLGTNSDYAGIKNFETRWGRFFNESDNDAGRRVVVLDEELATGIFGPENPVGQRVMIGKNSALVVGVLKKKDSALGFDSRMRAYIPLSYWKYLNPQTIIYELNGGSASKEQVYQAMDRTKKILERRHNAPNRYITFSMEQEIQAANKITGIMTLVIGAIAGISLLVGGIGVMNIMLVSVTERTREIGIRMALGARRRDILVQFLIEAIVLCVLGGVIGIILGYGGAWIIAKVAKWPPLVSWWIALGAFLFSAGVGVFFGIYPANKASKLDPIQALRRD
ncbi:ABC transporter permease [Desulforamulus ruminis]|uniref:ABC transport system permease protein n=1 Tax=Desulforamulus ruminis (strain ATCC 23193 / DSM 2154 / NCIMB 8452 / DL) TaxID=696281 RepID=F6DT91_DESRL|nr:ABC transporter permease [Desulforamulus ruminis]AEG58908.1 protein of unknown function DUF214 [Desulforamulus ruminis DSM 2154]